MKRLTIALVALAMLVAAPARAEEPDATKATTTRPHFGLHATLMRGTFATVPMTRAGVEGELRFHKVPLGMSLSFEGGRTDNGLGTHRATFAFDLRTPWPILAANVGAHVAYAVLVRTTGNDNFMRAVGGDIGSFAIGLHAGFEGVIPLGSSTNLEVGVRGAVDLYDGATGAMVGPQVGIVF